MNLGEFEHIVLLAILRLGEDAYAIRSAKRSRSARDGRSRAARSIPRSSGRDQALPALADERSAARARRPLAALLHRDAGGPGRDPDVAAQPAAAVAGPRRQARVMTALQPASASARRAAAGASARRRRVERDRSSAICTRSIAAACWTRRDSAARRCWYWRQACGWAPRGISGPRSVARRPSRAHDATFLHYHSRLLETRSCEPSDSKCAMPAAAS